MSAAFVPSDFVAPRSLDHAAFRLRPLGIEHNARDYAAWTSSIAHIRSTPGFVDAAWPQPMSVEANARDLARHAEDFAARRGFTFTVLDAADDVIGCVYIYPPREPTYDARVTSWVRADRAALDVTLHHCVRDWLARDWPFRRIDYAARDAEAVRWSSTSAPQR